jgi:hypothetical protein
MSMSDLVSFLPKKKNKLHGLSPRANYTDRATEVSFLRNTIQQSQWSKK